MSSIKNPSVHLQKLYQLLNKVREEKLGLDWQSKIFYSEIEEKIVAKIKEVQQTIRPKDMVK